MPSTDHPGSKEMPPPQPTHTVHHGDLPYSNPVLRSASPSGSINTEYGPDETTVEEWALSDEEFHRRVEAQLRLNQPRDAEHAAEIRGLRIPAYKPGTSEEKSV